MFFAILTAQLLSLCDIYFHQQLYDIKLGMRYRRAYRVDKAIEFTSQQFYDPECLRPSELTTYRVYDPMNLRPSVLS